MRHEGFHNGVEDEEVHRGTHLRAYRVRRPLLLVEEGLALLYASGQQGQTRRLAGRCFLARGRAGPWAPPSTPIVKPWLWPTSVTGHQW